MESSTSIKNQIARKLAMDDFNQMRDPQSRCTLGLIVNYGVSLVITQGLSEIDYKIADLYERRPIRRRNKLNKIVIYSSDTFVSNDGPEQQEVSSASHSRRVTKTDEMSARLETEMSSEMEVKIPFKGNTHFGFKFAGHSTQTKSQTEELVITAPSHKIVLDPFTRMNVTFQFYRYENINDYSLDFVLAESSTITYPDYNANIHYGDRSCCDDCFLYKDTVTRTVPFLTFLRENHDVIGNITYKKESSIRLEERNGQFILLNAGRATERITHFGVDVLFGTPEQI